MLRSAKKNSYATLKSSMETRETCLVLKIMGTRPVIVRLHTCLDTELTFLQRPWLLIVDILGYKLETVLSQFAGFFWVECRDYFKVEDLLGCCGWKYIPQDMSMALQKAGQPKDLNQASSFWCRDSHPFTSGRVKASAGKAPDARLRILRKWSDSHIIAHKKYPKMMIIFFFTFWILKMTWIASPWKTWTSGTSPHSSLKATELPPGLEVSHRVGTGSCF